MLKRVKKGVDKTVTFIAVVNELALGSSKFKTPFTAGPVPFHSSGLTSSWLRNN
jgi:hypothetical protein